MLEYLVSKYKDGRKDKKEVVYKLSYAGKFIIVKGKTLCGSLIIMRDAFEQFKDKHSSQYKMVHKKRWDGHIYKHWFNHILYHKGNNNKFSIHILYKSGNKINSIPIDSIEPYVQYRLLKTEQNQLDKYRYDKKCLNNNLQAYIPVYNENTDSFGWINKIAVMNFKRYLTSKGRKDYIKRYRMKPIQEPARSGL